jgi:phosphate:Na+ symporter
MIAMPDFLFNQPFLFGLLGGLGMFLYGMKIMSEGLQKIAGDRMRRILGALTDNRLIGMAVGMAVTALIQSSTATTVMVVGFINAGLISLMQALGVIIGANIGTTVTAQLIAFKIAKFALPAIGAGAALKLFTRQSRWQHIGEAVLGFGLIFLGLTLMKEAFDPLRGNPELQSLFLSVGDNPLLGVLIGAVVTILVQSSSATIGLTIAMATSGLLSYPASVALILGENIGTTLTANLAAFGTSLAARRAALAHMLYNVFGVGIMLLCFSWFTELITAITPGSPDFVIQTSGQAEQLGGAIGDKPFIARHIANAHTLFNVISALIFLPLIGPMARLTAALIPGREEAREFHLKYLDARVLNTPPIALAQARAETARMIRITGEVVDETLALLNDQDLRRMDVLRSKEDQVDLLQREITDFLVTLSQQSITAETSREVSALMHQVNDLERIGDHCMHLGRLVHRKLEQRIIFSEAGRREIADISGLVEGFFKATVLALDARDGTFIAQAQVLEDGIDRLEESLRNNHIARLNTGECTVTSGLIYIDMLHNLEKIGDHTFKLVRSLAGRA